MLHKEAIEDRLTEHFKTMSNHVFECKYPNELSYIKVRPEKVRVKPLAFNYTGFTFTYAADTVCVFTKDIGDYINIPTWNIASGYCFGTVWCPENATPTEALSMLRSTYTYKMYFSKVVKGGWLRGIIEAENQVKGLWEKQRTLSRKVLDKQGVKYGEMGEKPRKYSNLKEIK